MLRARSNKGILLVSALLVATLPAACGSEVNEGSGGAGGSGGSGGTGGAAPNFGACTGPGQCTLAKNSCCGPCSEPTLADVEPVHVDQVDEYSTFVCPEPTACPACGGAPNPDLFAYCEAGSCVEDDVSKHAFSECNAAADCTLRFGMDCCEACMGGVANLVAVASSSLQAMSALVCPPAFGCPPCAPVYPSEWKADCVAGHCAVVPAMP
ncbi:hypothetical protein [Polyangium sp. 6x1]|uniref:hypothetical protein n=1 Tax=Polyangium sp. 6x1 TaxID=3042689 RepID=UPI0024828847|nr:hypothetical protein [Polyangium sp. 6x1]MDI1445788.1 hypothetical protein [Polyangium sp. 6x1]